MPQNDITTQSLTGGVFRPDFYKRWTGDDERRTAHALSFNVERPDELGVFEAASGA